MNPPASISIVVVTHDSAAWLPEFFASWNQALAASRLLKDHGCRVVIADSGSADGTLETAKTACPAAAIIECGNIGYGAAANRGVAAAGTTWVLICNPDLVFPEDFALKLLDPVLDELRAEPLWQNGSCIAPRLVNPDGSEQASVGEFPTIGSVLRDQFRPREMRKYVHPPPHTAATVDWATGACLLLKRQAFEAVSGFDEQFFLYVEEVDLQRRLWASGRETWFAPEVTVIHHAPNAARAPRASVQKWSARGMLRYFARHGSMFDLLGYKTMALLSWRLSLGEVLRGRKAILKRSTR